MLQLISLNDRQELVASTDTAVQLPDEERHPVHFLELASADLNGSPPTVFKIRPLNSREAMQLLAYSDDSQTKSIIKAAELGLVSVLGPEQPGLVPAVTDDAIQHLISALPPDHLASLGAHIIAESLKRQDPTEPSASD